MRFLFVVCIASLSLIYSAFAQTGNPYMLPTAITAAGTYPTTPIPVGSPNTAIVTLQATGSGSGLSFKLQGIPIGSSTPQDLQLFTAPVCSATLTSGTANGTWFANVSGYSKIQLVVATITGTETFGITNSMQPNCASAALGGTPTAPSVVTGNGTAGSPDAGVLTIQGITNMTPIVTTSEPLATTPAQPDISTVTTGGIAVNAFSATHCARGCIVGNPKGATVDLCANGTAAASGTVSFQALICIPPGQQYGFTARANAISVISSDSAHPFWGEGYQ